MRRIKRVEPFSVVRISAIIYAVIGFVEGIMFGIFFIVPRSNPNSPELPRVSNPVLAILAIVFFPILFAAIGAIGGGLGAAIYNFAAKRVGGIQVQVE